MHCFVDSHQGTHTLSQVGDAYVNTTTELNSEPRSDWEIWTAAIMTDTASRDLFIGSVKRWVSDGLSSQPLGDWYQATNGEPESFRARPVVGGHLGT